MNVNVAIKSPSTSKKTYDMNEVGLFNIDVPRPIEFVRRNFHYRCDVTMISAAKVNMLSTSSISGEEVVANMLIES